MLRRALRSSHTYRFLIHDRDSIFSQPLDQGVCNLGLRAVKTPVRGAQANALCERLIGTLNPLEVLAPPEPQRVRITIHEPIVESPDETLAAWHQVYEGWAEEAIALDGSRFMRQEP